PLLPGREQHPFHARDQLVEVHRSASLELLELLLRPMIVDASPGKALITCSLAMTPWRRGSKQRARRLGFRARRDRSGKLVAGRRAYFFFGVYRSVSVPSYASAANMIVSDNVGCGWMVSPVSAASQPISMARAISEIRSPAFGPTTPPPMTRRVVGSNSSLVSPSSRPSESARPLAAHGKLAFS